MYFISCVRNAFGVITILPLIPDIQEFYEATLADHTLSTHEKTQATLRVAERYADGSHRENGGIAPHQQQQQYDHHHDPHASPRHGGHRMPPRHDDHSPPAPRHEEPHIAPRHVEHNEHVPPPRPADRHEVRNYTYNQENVK